MQTCIIGPMKKILASLILFASLLQGRAQEIHAFRNQVEEAYPFYLYTPEGYNTLPDSLKARKPLVLFLHGGSLKGTNLTSSIRYGCIDAVRFGRNIDAIIVNPQTAGWTKGAKGTWHPERLCRILDWTLEHFPYDTNRVYVLGMSMGGYGTLDFVNAHPERVAAAMALCGGCSYKEFDGIAEVPTWIIHGSADEKVKVSQSQRVYDWLVSHEKSKRVIFDILVGYDHGALARYFYMPMTYKWLFSHSKTQEGHPVNRKIPIEEPLQGKAYANPDAAFKARVKLIDPGIVPAKK